MQLSTSRRKARTKLRGLSSRTRPAQYGQDDRFAETGYARENAALCGNALHECFTFDSRRGNFGAATKQVLVRQHLSFYCGIKIRRAGHQICRVPLLVLPHRGTQGGRRVNEVSTSSFSAGVDRDPPRSIATDCERVWMLLVASCSVASWHSSVNCARSVNPFPNCFSRRRWIRSGVSFRFRM